MDDKPGVVYLIGAGPGDPGLITLRGAEVLSKADVVVYDRLAHPQLLKLAHPNSERIYVGKASANHAMKQPEINQLMVNRALQGLAVARLKGGDPFVFGRGGEEAEHCRANGIRFEIVPGVTSAIAAAAYAGIPVTHRDAASSFAVVTGHERGDDLGPSSTGTAEGRRDWKHIAWAADTLVFLMGFENLMEITNRLIENGRDSDTPVAIVQWGTWSAQRVVTGVLSSIVEEAKSAGIASPAVCIVGDVVKLRGTLRWFDDTAQRPLLGKRVLVTRSREQASALTDLLKSYGADPIEFPTIRIVPRTSTSELEVALRSLKDYCWLVFTSANSVEAVADLLDEIGLDSRDFYGSQIAAIGPATVEALARRLNIRANYMPAEAVAESVLENWPDGSMSGKRVLFPCAAESRAVLPDGLRSLGAEVDVIRVYDTVLDSSGAAELIEQLDAGALDILTFTSSSTALNFIKAIGSPDEGELTRLTRKCLIAAIGPITAQTLRDCGLQPQIVAAEHTVPGLAAAIVVHYQNEPKD
jgi:uroporphyrinogen III methyltransferase/synthase